jgi:Cu-Zn family superoxide dismutase
MWTKQRRRVHILVQGTISKQNINRRFSCLSGRKEAKEMRNCLLLGISALFLVTTAFGQSAEKAAHADMYNAKGEKIGTATFREAQGGVKIDVEVAQLPPGLHAVHVHAVGKCEAPDFKSAGAHLNPEGKKHGTQNPEGPHAGDLPNLEVGADGRAKTSVLGTRVSLSDATNSLFPTNGTSLVIHEKPDDNLTDPAGNAGARIACGLAQR